MPFAPSDSIPVDHNASLDPERKQLIDRIVQDLSNLAINSTSFLQCFSTRCSLSLPSSVLMIWNDSKLDEDQVRRLLMSFDSLSNNQSTSDVHQILQDIPKGLSSKGFSCHNQSNPEIKPSVEIDAAMFLGNKCMFSWAFTVVLRHSSVTNEFKLRHINLRGVARVEFEENGVWLQAVELQFDPKMLLRQLFLETYQPQIVDSTNIDHNHSLSQQGNARPDFDTESAQRVLWTKQFIGLISVGHSAPLIEVIRSGVDWSCASVLDMSQWDEPRSVRDDEMFLACFLPPTGPIRGLTETSIKVLRVESPSLHNVRALVTLSGKHTRKLLGISATMKQIHVNGVMHFLFQSHSSHLLEEIVMSWNMRSLSRQLRGESDVDDTLNTQIPENVEADIAPQISVKVKQTVSAGIDVLPPADGFMSGFPNTVPPSTLLDTGEERKESLQVDINKMALRAARKNSMRSMKSRRIGGSVINDNDSTSTHLLTTRPVLVTCATSFLGLHIVTLLFHRGYCVRCAVPSGTDSTPIQRLMLQDANRIELVS